MPAPGGPRHRAEKSRLDLEAGFRVYLSRVSKLRISEVAALSGFSSATLRYYEKIGLMAPPVRTASGYRVYDERAVARLTFIGRARQVGLTLDAIGALARLWDQDECAVLQGPMSGFVHSKLEETAARITELQILRRQLENLAGRLSEEKSSPGACDERCACNDLGAPVPRPTVELGSASVAQGEPAIACTLGAGEVEPRVAQWEALLGRATEQSVTEGGRRLWFAYDPAVATELAMLVASEQACCAFLDFTLRIARDRITLEVAAPEAAAPMLGALFGAAT